MQFDLVIVGASFAGLAAARTAASRGLSTAVIEAKPDVGARVASSGILVREAIEEIDIPHHLTRRVPGVRLYSPSLKSVDLFSPGYAFFTTRTPDLLRWMAHEARDAGAHVLTATRYEGARRDGDLIRLNGIDIAARYLVGADGMRSRIAADFGLAANRTVLTGLEVELEPNDAVDPRFLHCFVNSRLAPGFIAWAAPGPDCHPARSGRAPRRQARPCPLHGPYRAPLRLEPAEGGRPAQRLDPLRRAAPPHGGPRRSPDRRRRRLGVAGDRRRHPARLPLRPPRRRAHRRSPAMRRPAPEVSLAREIPRFRAKSALRRALDLAPPNLLIDLALATTPARRFAEKVYFHSRNATGVDRAAYLRWLETEVGTAEGGAPLLQG